MRLRDVITPEQLERFMFLDTPGPELQERMKGVLEETTPYREMIASHMMQAQISPNVASLWMSLLVCIAMHLKTQEEGFAATPVTGPTQ